MAVYSSLLALAACNSLHIANGSCLSILCSPYVMLENHRNLIGKIYDWQLYLSCQLPLISMAHFTYSTCPKAYVAFGFISYVALKYFTLRYRGTVHPATTLFAWMCIFKICYSLYRMQMLIQTPTLRQISFGLNQVFICKIRVSKLLNLPNHTISWINFHLNTSNFY